MSFVVCNRETVPLSRLGELDPSVFSVPPLAVESRLAFLRAPPVTTDTGEDAAVALNDRTWGKELYAQVLASVHYGFANYT